MKLISLVTRTCMLLLLAFGLTQVGYASPKTLIEMEGGKPKAGLAKSWKKVKAGEYEFELDTSAEVKKGTKLSPDLVKSSLEAKLASSMGVKVTPKGANKVVVAYTGDENKFLDQVAKTKIRGGVELALQSSTSEGGIRAKKQDRPAGAGEVKGVVVAIAGGMITAKVLETKSDKVKMGAEVKIKGKVEGLKKGDSVFFKPGKKDGAAWLPVAGSLQ